MKSKARSLEDEQLANGVMVRFYDESRRVAGDRWQVTVRYDVVVSVPETFWGMVSAEPEILKEIRATLGSEIVLSNSYERNFISVEEKEGLIADVISRTRKNIFGYLADPGFPESYFKRRFKEASAEIERKKREAWVPDNEDIEEPLDFSHLFSDKK